MIRFTQIISLLTLFFVFHVAALCIRMEVTLKGGVSKEFAVKLYRRPYNLLNCRCIPEGMLSKIG